MTAEIGIAACVFRSVEILAVTRHAGFDFLIADMEHGAMSLAEAASLCVAGREAGFPVYVRVPRSSSDDLTRAADCGAQAIIVPHVDSVEEARLIVDKLRFPPRGNRSLPSPVASSGFKPVPARDLIAGAEAGFRLFAMVESAQALHDVEAMAALDGLDGLVIGSQDLAQALGHTGDLTHPDVTAAFARVANAARASAKVFGLMGVPKDLLASHAFALDAGLIVVTNEINLLFEAAEQRVAEIRHLMESVDSR
ncbi:aldolase/citrate lyase family protein [Mesorhizobium sp. CAU 1732]|uniref:HpcH/HpaI aldolase family protein n=1 Tax=Mesorhizobium sp. CAU 1732 TaxID=3140358 RepID=UPI003260FD99